MSPSASTIVGRGMAERQEATAPDDSDRASRAALEKVARQIRWLTVAVFAMAFALLLVVAAVLGAVIDFHAGEGVLISGTATGGAATGFAFGWLARGR
ncbi:MAG: hypothetical protein WDZ59_09985 [Pirellulales bacterium]